MQTVENKNAAKQMADNSYLSLVYKSIHKIKKSVVIKSKNRLIKVIITGLKGLSIILDIVLNRRLIIGLVYVAPGELGGFEKTK
jgi:hypothetical protein